MHKHVKSILSTAIFCVVGAGAGLAVANAYLNYSAAPTYQVGNYSEQRAIAGSQVILLGTAWCGFCKSTRTYFSKNNISYADLDVEKSAEARKILSDLGAKGVPLVLIGDRLISGYQPEAMDAAIEAYCTLKPELRSDLGCT